MTQPQWAGDLAQGWRWLGEIGQREGEEWVLGWQS